MIKKNKNQKNLKKLSLPIYIFFCQYLNGNVQWHWELGRGTLYKFAKSIGYIIHRESKKGDTCEMFRQDSAPAHRARETIKLLQRETPAFISPDLWPPNSPDLNPVNYKICGVMQDRVYQKKSEGRERVERATGWSLGRTATERDWWCHRPVAQMPACMRSG